jgi:hypothetical protein
MKFVATTVLAAGLLLGSTQAAAPADAPAVVRATIWPNVNITFSPNKFTHGTVVMKVKNRTDSAHTFSINGVTWPKIKPHTIVGMKVTFKRRGVYSATLPDCTYLSPCSLRPDVSPIGTVKVT